MINELYKRTGVVAYNHSRYLDFLRELSKSAQRYTIVTHGISTFDGREVFYVGLPNSLRGMRDYELYWYDDWYRRDDIDKIKDIDRPNQWAMGKTPPYDPVNKNDDN